MRVSNAHLLLIVNFLVTLGIVIPVFAKQILRHGGNHIILGFVQSAVFVAQFISLDVLGLIEREKLYIIKLSVYCCFVYFTLLMFVVSWWAVSIIRLSFGTAITSQVLIYSKQLVTKVEQRDRKIQIRNLLDIMRVSGMSVGSIAGGYIYQSAKDFVSIAGMASVISFASILILHLIDYNENEIPISESQIAHYRKSCNDQLLNLRDTTITDEWYDVALKLSYTCAFVIYFTRFAFLLCYNYPVNSIIIGWTRAYYNVVLFISNFIVPFIKERTSDKLGLLEKSLIICAFCLIGHSYAPTYNCYMVLYIPLLFTYTLSNSLLDDDALELRYNFRVYQYSQTMETIIKICAPFAVGIIRQYSGGGVPKLLTILPAVVYGCMLTFRFMNQKPRKKRLEEDDDSDNDNKEDKEIYNDGEEDEGIISDTEYEDSKTILTVDNPRRIKEVKNETVETPGGRKVMLSTSQQKQRGKNGQSNSKL